jgi:D-serine deaminase-like pyridoxal phosphate-dependent protein
MEEDRALRVPTTVTSRPTAEQAIIDAEPKTLSSDTSGLAGFGHVCQYADAMVYKLNEGHGYVDGAGSHSGRCPIDHCLQPAACCLRA